jgi:hypothetical protein
MHIGLNMANGPLAVQRAADRPAADAGQGGIFDFAYRLKTSLYTLWIPSH